MSRPKKELTKLAIETIAQMAAGGNTEGAIRRAVGIHSNDTWIRLKKEDHRVPEALDQGKGRLQAEIVGILLEQARKGNVVPAIFLAKTQLGWRENEPPADPGRVHVTFNLPAPMTPEQYGRTIEASAVEPPKEVTQQ